MISRFLLPLSLLLSLLFVHVPIDALRAVAPLLLVYVLIVVFGVLLGLVVLKRVTATIAQGLWAVLQRCRALVDRGVRVTRRVQNGSLG